jgi:ABC transporter substrate binding protein
LTVVKAFASDACSSFISPWSCKVLARELVDLQPDVLLAHSAQIAGALHRQTRTIPIVFVNVSDPIGAGFVDSLARPGGNMTGLLHYEEGIVGKWLGLLKEIAPGLARAALLADPKSPVYDYFVRSANAASASLAIEVVPGPVENAADVERKSRPSVHPSRSSSTLPSPPAPPPQASGCRFPPGRPCSMVALTVAVHLPPLPTRWR